jgi:hypothetical protein
MHLLSILFLLLGIILIFIHRAITPIPKEIEYRYLPRTLDQILEDGAYTADVFQPMFNEDGPWIKMSTQSKMV